MSSSGYTPDQWQDFAGSIERLYILIGHVAPELPGEVLILFSCVRCSESLHAADSHLCHRDMSVSMQIINDQDLIARGGKFWRIYKRPGQRVLIDKSGTMVVRYKTQQTSTPSPSSQTLHASTNISLQSFI